MNEQKITDALEKINAQFGHGSKISEIDFLNQTVTRSFNMFSPIVKSFTVEKNTITFLNQTKRIV